MTRLGAPPRADLKVGPYEVCLPAWRDGMRRLLILFPSIIPR
ncbi:hypothetical protein LCGC14_2781040, partial [marine sediment metagenome]